MVLNRHWWELGTCGWRLWLEVPACKSWLLWYNDVKRGLALAALHVRDYAAPLQAAQPPGGAKTDQLMAQAGSPAAVAPVGQG